MITRHPVVVSSFKSSLTWCEASVRSTANARRCVRHAATKKSQPTQPDCRVTGRVLLNVKRKCLESNQMSFQLKNNRYVPHTSVNMNSFALDGSRRPQLNTKVAAPYARRMRGQRLLPVQPVKLPPPSRTPVGPLKPRAERSRINLPRQMVISTNQPALPLALYIRAIDD